MIIGQHLLIECRGRHADLDAEQLLLLMTDAALAGGATVLFQHFHKFGDQGGVTGVLILAESHITVHTWPEHHYAAFDVFMCGKARPEAAAQVIAARFPEADVFIKTVDRACPTSTPANSASAAVAVCEPH
ncbi:MAG: adenosylmethionine decarboxylase [Gammaproteobacteria bacterium]|nr:adenosylmethionine decarboxylase [Gammaproteobacteria bacterium]MBQ0840388.1 adenosylmethionine decarboxylase [Gammaproteobacteria bacterium]